MTVVSVSGMLITVPGLGTAGKKRRKKSKGETKQKSNPVILCIVKSAWSLGLD